jgi:hypothetical protein
MKPEYEAVLGACDGLRRDALALRNAFSSFVALDGTGKLEEIPVRESELHRAVDRLAASSSELQKNFMRALAVALKAKP